MINLIHSRSARQLTMLLDFCHRTATHVWRGHDAQMFRAHDTYVSYAVLISAEGFPGRSTNWQYVQLQVQWPILQHSLHRFNALDWVARESHMSDAVVCQSGATRQSSFGM